MKVAQICARYAPYIGGVESHVMMISESIRSRNIDVEILTTDPSGKLPSDSFINGIQIRRFRSFAPGEAYYFSPRLHSFLRKHSSDYDIVHAHSYHSFPAVYAALTKKSKLVLTPHYHGSGHTQVRRMLHVPYRFIGNMVLERADVVISVSSYERSLLVKDFKGIKAKTVIIPNGLKLQEFQELSKKKTTKKQILYVGRLEKYKRIDCLIKSLRYLPDDIQLQIIGTGPDKNRLLTLVSLLELRDRVVFLENLDRANLLQRYVDSSVFVLLSAHEAYGITVAEALASGTPCVVANTSALTEFIDNKNCFGVADPEQPEDVANVVLMAMVTKVEKFKFFGWEEVAWRILDIYRAILAKSSALATSTPFLE
jgi:glycosyltransferase involved in cell wall biosynthesis